jgi:hypothetical protein
MSFDLIDLTSCLGLNDENCGVSDLGHVTYIEDRRGVLD